MNVAGFKKEDWDDLTEKIEDEYCILLIGPNLYKDVKGNVLQEVLYNRLRDKYRDELFDMFPEDGFFVPTDNRIVNDMRFDVKKFYKKEYPNENLKKIVQIPFHSIITLTPDMLMKRTFDKYDVQYQFERFSMTKPVNKELQDASKQNPLIYNMFGSIEEDATIILTHNDFFEYLKNIIGNERLPAQVQKAINKATDLIFLGFPFEKWWVQLLMRLLGLHSFPGRNRWAIKGKFESNFTKITKRQFRIQFIEDDADEFIDTLYSHYCSKELYLRKLNKGKLKVELAQAEIKGKRIDELRKQIRKAMDIREDYENNRLLSDRPKEIERCNMEISKLTVEIDLKSAELQSFKN